MANLPANWSKWVIESLLSGVSAQVILQKLLDNGFTFETCKKALGRNLPDNLIADRGAAFYRQLANPLLLKQLNQYNAEYLTRDKAQLLKLDDFLSAHECDELVALSKTRLHPSTIAATHGYEGFRTSTTCDLPDLSHPLVASLESKIVRCLSLGVGESELIQAQHYGRGQEFKAHTDYFEPGADEFREHAQNRGQRTWTFMLYLNEDCEGGETEFLHLATKVKPKKGMALTWNNLNLDGSPNPDTLHQAHPVLSGEKVVVTKWFRDKN